MEITKTKDVWIVWSQTDLIEGRGSMYPLAICEKEATAKRIGHKNYVQGSNCPITKGAAYKIGGEWFAPARIYPPSREDDSEQARIDKKKEVMERARMSGLTDDDLKILVS